MKDGRVVEGLPGFKPGGNGITTCWYCGRSLTDEISIARGVGSECIKEHGCMPGREWVEEFAKPFKAYQSAQKRASKPIKSFKEWHEKHIKREVVKV
ncbi:MAG: DUF6011 domain-containing protein [Candidatus Methanomethylophilaceae archaeon]